MNHPTTDGGADSAPGGDVSRDHVALSEALPKELERILKSPSFVLSFSAAQAVRDRAASLVLTDPSLAYKLSSDLLNALHRSTQETEARTRAVVWRCRAEACVYTGRSREAREAYEKASGEARAAGDRKLLGQILVGRVGLVSLLGGTSEAIQLAKEAERLLRREGDLLYLGKLFMNLGNAFYHQERFSEAYEAYGHSTATLESAGQRDATWIGLLINQAIACTQLSRIGEARKLFLQTEAYCREFGFSHLEAQAQFNRAFLEQVRGDFRQALSLLEESGRVFEQHGEVAMVAATERARSELYLELGMPREALELARSSAASFSREDMTIDQMLSNIAEARALLALETPGEAEKILESVRSFYRTRRNRPSRAVALLFLATTKLGQGEIPQARSAARRALRAFESLGMLQRVSEARRLLASTDLQADRPHRAEEVLRPALSQARNLPVGERLKLWALSGWISAARGRRREAISRFRRAVRCIELQRRLIPGVEFRARAFEHHVTVYHGLIQLILASRRPSLQFLFSLVEAARARGFRERLRSRALHAKEGILEKRARLGALLRRVEEAEYSSEPSPTKLQESHSRIRKLEREIEGEVQRAQVKEPGGAAWRDSRDPKEIAACLRPEEVVLEYFVSGESVVAFVMTRQHQTFLNLPSPAASVQENVERIRFQLDMMALTAERPLGSSEFLRSSADAVLRNLHSQLLEPLAEWLPASGRIIVVPHRFLHQVPFECLTDGKGYLNEKWDISRIPTADFIGLRRRRRGRRKQTVLVAGIVEGGPAFVASEMQSVASCFPNDDVRLMRDPTTEALLRELPSSDIVHLTTHAVFRDDNPVFSRLSMKNGALFLADILDSRLRAELVVLSACNTGQVFTGRGDDLSGVAHGFLAAGARQLVASLWRVHDEATEDLMSAFYRNYVEGAKADPVEALSSAGRQLRHRWQHPFYWGGFSVHGR